MQTCSVHALPYRADPTTYFDLIKEAEGAVLLDSGRPVATRGRYDLMSAWPLATVQIKPDESGRVYFDRLRHALDTLGEAALPDDMELPFAGGLIGYLAYDFGRRLERLPNHAQDDLGLPEARLGLYGWALISDHERMSSQLVFHPSLADSEREHLVALFSSAPAPAQHGVFRLEAPFNADITAEQYRQGIESIQAYISSGDCYQINFTQRFQAPCTGSSWHAYRALRAACPTPFSGYIRIEGGAVLSHSPERFLQLKQRQVETRPIKGTRPRGTDPQSDAALAAELLASPKDRAENVMIVDLLRNDLGRSCRTGSVRVPELFALESYPNVHHLVSSVRGELADGLDVFNLLAGSFPGGSITGAPKIRAMEIIDELEATRRALYCGSLLYIDVRGEMDSSIAIRSVLIKSNRAYCWGGGGIVKDSTWQEEYAESIAKVSVLMKTLEAL
ncbi:para-aminobenzoate synthetase component 1 [Pseudomonas duriflava]|uniref:aminodeoxychorismate synthase n=1 Tax=Pseudomonas duriflava TaxID=459528 RepID=A0A562Q9T9_9PSED|nr:aminodeoxychorismate synthase component I [Pseudomonas duriflava]TWI53474.1 para-aminobenzoate synthetase component 1 [Pseudomonas duriflava]